MHYLKKLFALSSILLTRLFYSILNASDMCILMLLHSKEVSSPDFTQMLSFNCERYCYFTF